LRKLVSLSRNRKNFKDREVDEEGRRKVLIGMVGTVGKPRERGAGRKTIEICFWDWTSPGSQDGHLRFVRGGKPYLTHRSAVIVI